ncbi:DUF4235 domain-containing protein [Streptomyces sp. NPDC048383]|uniref:DUF4235 domain-containing protein n=1 Tax=Streptomyces sp. NPDC048383 TaxID=3155386 RepID=UPI003442B633
MRASRIGQDDEAGRRALRREDLIAAALQQGWILAVVKVAVDRSGAAVTRRLTSTWPG